MAVSDECLLVLIQHVKLISVVDSLLVNLKSFILVLLSGAIEIVPKGDKGIIIQG
jgi:hypothetical protein